MTAVFVASSDRLFREAARDFLDRRAGWSCAGTAEDGIGALAALARALPDVLLATEDVGRLGSLSLARQVHARWPSLAVVVLGRKENPAARVVDPAADVDEVLEALRSPPVEGEAAPAPDRGRELALLAELTKRERVVLKLVANGASLQVAARELGVSAHTVRTHVQNLYDKIDCHSRLELVRFAERHGLISKPAADAHQ